MSDNRAIALLMALYIGGISGGLVSSILLNIPGTPASMVTAFDGAPMARKGEGAKALGTGIFFSFLGTIFGLIALMIIAPYLAAVAIKFGAFEYCALSIFSLVAGHFAGRQRYGQRPGSSAAGCHLCHVRHQCF